MPRIRYLKPDFFKDEDLAKHPFETRLFFEGLWCFADKAGRLEDRPSQLKADIFPYDNVDIEKCLTQLAEKKRYSGQPFINRYVVGGRKYIQIITWNKHQRPPRTESDSVIPSSDGVVTVSDPPPNKRIRNEVYERDNYKCAYCNLTLSDNLRKICLTHVVPPSMGGANSKKNLATSCKKCNAKKGDLTPVMAGLKHPNGLGEMIRQHTVNIPLTISDGCSQGKGNGKGNGKGEGEKEATPPVLAPLNKNKINQKPIKQMSEQIKIDRSFGKCCYFCGCSSRSDSGRFVWRERKPFCELRCYKFWVQKGRPEPALNE